MTAVSPSRKSSPCGTIVLEQVRALAVVVDRAGERAAEAAEVRAPFEIADVVGERADVFRIAVVVLKGDADLGLVDAAVDADHVAVRGRSRCG